MIINGTHSRIIIDPNIAVNPKNAQVIGRSGASSFPPDGATKADNISKYRCLRPVGGSSKVGKCKEVNEKEPPNLIKGRRTAVSLFVRNGSSDGDAIAGFDRDVV